MIHALTKCSKIQEDTEKWAETRREAVKALGSIVCTALPWLNQELVPHVFDCFMIALEDYTVDERGAWVREAVMSGIECLSLALLSVGVGKVQETHHFPGDALPGEAGHEKIACTRDHNQLVAMSNRYVFQKYHLKWVLFQFISCFFRPICPIIQDHGSHSD